MKIIQECDYPVVALKKNETLGEIHSLVYPLLLNDYSMQKTVPSIQFAKAVNGRIELLGMAVNHTANDDKQLKVFMNHTKERIEKEEVPLTSAWETGDSYYNVLLNYAHSTKADIIAVVFENDPGFIERIWGTKDEELLGKTDLPLLIVKGKEWKSLGSFRSTG